MPVKRYSGSEATRKRPCRENTMLVECFVAPVAKTLCQSNVLVAPRHLCGENAMPAERVRASEAARERPCCETTMPVERFTCSEAARKRPCGENTLQGSPQAPL